MAKALRGSAARRLVKSNARRAGPLLTGPRLPTADMTALTRSFAAPRTFAGAIFRAVFGVGRVGERAAADFIRAYALAAFDP